MRFFTPEFSLGFRRFFEALPEAPDTEIHAAASLEVARAAARLRREEGLLVVGIDLAGQEKGYPAEDHREAYQVAHEAFLGKTVHAGEDYGPESIFQAIGDLHADRIGHGTWLFDETQDHEPEDPRPQAATSRTSRSSSRTSASRSRSASPRTSRPCPSWPTTCASTPSARCAGGGSPPRSAPTTASSRTPR